MENFHGHERVAHGLQGEDLDTISAGKNLHFGHFGKLHFGKIIAIAVGVAIGGSVLQTIDQSTINH